MLFLGQLPLNFFAVYTSEAGINLQAKFYCLHVTNDENAVNVARTRGNFVDPTCHE
jgi:hypothetical protein